VIAGSWLWIGKGCAESRAEAEAAEVATLRTNLLQAKADSAGWETRLTAATRNLQAGLLKEALRGDSAERAAADLLQELEAAGARILTLTNLVAEAGGRVTDAVEVFLGADACNADSVTADVDDGLLEGRWVYWPSTSLFDLSYAVSPPLQIVQTLTADNRLLTGVRSTDPRVVPRIQEVFFQLPEREMYCSWRTKGKYAGGGALAAALAALVGG
jgi:hypothetical protein